MSITVPFGDLRPSHDPMRDELLAQFVRVLDNSYYIQGPFCKEFENKFAAFCGVSSCIGCGNGLDALQMIFRAMGIGEGDEVIVPAHTFIASALAVTYSGAKPVFVDVDPSCYCIDPDKIAAAITPLTKAILIVHIYGQIGNFDAVADIARSNGLRLVEDAAQAHGSLYKGQKAGSLADAAGFSFYPVKGLGALGDGGAVVTNDPLIAESVRMIGNYGSKAKYEHKLKGFNSRLDELQAALLLPKLLRLDAWNRARATIARRYLSEIRNKAIILPKINSDSEHTWHIFPVFASNRTAFVRYLGEHGIQSIVHYPVPMHLHDAYRDLGHKEGNFPVAEFIAAHEASLPIYAGMTDEQVSWTIDVINSFRP